MCTHYLVEFCPYELFQNTKSDIGTCPKRYHEESLREKYRSHEGDRFRAEWERDFYNFIEKLVTDLERKLRRGKDRLDVRPSELPQGSNAEIDALEERRTLLDLQIKDKLAQIESLGEQGEITKAQVISEQVDALKAELDQVLKQEAENPSFRLEKRMEVCQTCGAFLIVGDAQKRIESHFEGRQHTGWARVRQALQEYQEKMGHRRDYHRRQTDYDRDRHYHREQGEIRDRRDRHDDRRPRDDYRQRERSPYHRR